MKSTYLSAAAFTLALAATQASAAPIVVTIGQASTNAVVTFDEAGITGGLSGTLKEGILSIGGVGFAERFVGQGLTISGDFDVLDGTATNPLALQPGATGQNLMVLEDPLPFGNGTQILAGMGTSTVAFDAIGEGSFAILFGQDQFTIGLDLLAGDLGNATLQFFSRTGELIESLQIGSLAEQSYTFSFGSGYAGSLIAGVSVHNLDDNGIFLDNVRYSISNNGQIPEPGSLALVGLALLGLTATRGRKLWA